MTPSWLWVRWKRWGGGLNLVLMSYVARFKVLGLNPAQSLASTLATQLDFSAWVSYLVQGGSTSHGVPGSQGDVDGEPTRSQAPTTA